MPDPYFSELKYLGGPTLDFVEVTVDAGTDISDLEVTIYFADGTIRSSNSLVGIVPNTIAGRDVYVIDTTSSGTFNGLALHNGISLSDSSTGTVYSFLSFDDTPTPVTATEGPANGLTSTEIGMAGAGSSLESTDGTSYTLQTNPTPGSIPCFTKGTQITLPGDRYAPIEALAVGDEVCVADGGTSTIRWIGRKVLRREDLALNAKLLPVRIVAGALGNGFPKRDLLVSRQHRILVRSIIAERMFEQTEVLVSAIKLTGLPGIFVDDTVCGLEYFHLLFDRHEIIFAEGAPSESLFTGPEALHAIGAEARDELLAIFPELSDMETSPSYARLTPSSKQQEKLISRHLKNKKPCLGGQDIVNYSGSGFNL